MRSLARSLVAVAVALPLAAAAQGRGRTELTSWGRPAFGLRTPGGAVVAIDPWLPNPRSPDGNAAQRLEKVDSALVTRGHTDRVGDAIEIAKRTGAKLVASGDLGRALVAAGRRARGAPRAPRPLMVSPSRPGMPVEPRASEVETARPARHAHGTASTSSG